MMSEQWNTLPMATVHLVEERRCEALAAQYRVQQQARRIFLLRLATLILICSVAFAGWLLLIAIPYALHNGAGFVQPTPTRVTYPCANVRLVEDTSGHVTAMTDYACP